MFSKILNYVTLSIAVLGAAKPVVSEFQSGAVAQGLSDTIGLASAASQQLITDPQQQQEEQQAAALAQATIPALAALFQKHAEAAAASTAKPA